MYLTRQRKNKEILNNLRDIPSDNSGESSIDEDEYYTENTMENNGSSSDDNQSDEMDDEDDSLWEIAVDCTEWREQTNTDEIGRFPARNIFRATPGPTCYARKKITNEAISSFNLLISNDILKHIQNCTEIEARKVTNNSTWKVSLDELKAFIGLLYLRGVEGQKNKPIRSFWSSRFGCPYFNETLSRNRFYEVMQYLKFDVRGTRRERLKNDKFALMSDVWQMFINNSRNCYIPSSNLTVDEQLLATKARCKFTQYMPSKPGKFGIKFWIIADCKSKYMLNSLPYLGKDESRPSNVPLGEYVVLTLSEPYLGKGYNITCDNYFTSVSLANKLNSKKTSLVGTMKNNRREINAVSLKKSTSSMNIHETKVFENNFGHTLTAYQCKKNKNVKILSSYHRKVNVMDNPKKT